MVEPPESTSTFSLESALDAEIVREAETAQLDVPTNVPVREPVYDPVMGLVKLLSCKELEIVPIGKPEGSTYDEVMALDEDTAHEAVPVSDPAKDPEKDPVMGLVKLLSCKELEIVPTGNPLGSTYEDVIALDADDAQLEVPNTEPVNPLPLKIIPLPLINNDPVMTALPLNGNPVLDGTFNA